MPSPSPTPSSRGRHAAGSQRDAGALAVGAARAAAVPLVIAAVATASAPGWTAYRVQPGDTLSVLAQRSGSSVRELVRVNGLPPHGRYVEAGAVIQVPAGGPSRRAAAPARTRAVTHRVTAGESLWEIAHANGMTTGALMRANQLSSTLIHPGDVLRVGTTTAPAPTAAASAARAQPARIPSRDRMRAIIEATARANGVDPALALAVSWQETGFQHDKVSVANAIGAMQVLPSTGEWISGLVGRSLDLRDPRDNATAGVVLLRFLLREADATEQAVGAYYQGLTSIRTRGMYEDTKAYVRNVMALRGRFS